MTDCVGVNMFLACLATNFDRVIINAINLWISSPETNDKIAKTVKKKK